MEENSAPLFSNEGPEDIAEFRVFSGPEDTIAIPESPYKRKSTDVPFLIILAICILAFIPFAIYTSYHTDSDRFLNGFDVCGNICGRKNNFVEGSNCSDIDLSYMPYGRTNGTCAFDCPTDKYFKIFGNRCFSNDTDNAGLQVVTEFFNTLPQHITYGFLSFLIGLVMCLLWFCGILIKTTIAVFATIAAFIIKLTILATVSWIQFANDEKGILQPLIFTTVMIVAILLSYGLYERIHLAIKIFKEAAKVISDIPSIVLIPISNFIVLSALATIYMCSMFTVWYGSGVLELTDSSEYTYAFNGLIIFTISFGTFLCCWLYFFQMGCQHLIVANIVASHYFARDKSTIRTPIYNSCYSLFRCHLGTVALGSLILIVVKIIKIILHVISSLIPKFCEHEDYCHFFKFISRNAYTQTALHGRSFLKSGKRAVELEEKASHILALSSLEAFFLGIAMVNIILWFFGINMISSHLSPYFIPFGILFTVILADCLFSVFGSVVNTIHMCVSEDKCMNDGITSPYYMTTNVMEYMEGAKKFKTGLFGAFISSKHC